MKRVVLAAIVLAAAGAVMFDAPVRASTGYAATMVNGTTPGTFKFAHGICSNSSGDGSFTIQVGDQVTWTNCTQADHTVTGDNGSFGNDTHIPPGGSYAQTFTV